MKLHLDPTRCQGYGLCNEKAPGLVELDEWGYASVADPAVPDGAEADARAAAEVCPAQALRLDK
ncbi:ferredoxin [Actinoallomurus acanthiterrae]